MNKTYQWAIIGAGPAGIAVVGKLLDLGISASSILWIDPFFEAGDFGRLWSNVSSNTKVHLFTRFLNDAASFNYDANAYQLKNLNPEQTCKLNYMAEPLRDITTTLLSKVDSHKGLVKEIELSNRKWHLVGDDFEFQSCHTILAFGATPLALNYPETKNISLDIAMDKEKLITAVSPDDILAVFGSSHSAVIIMKYLVEIGVEKIINFYKSPCRYAVDLGDWILFDDTGLKGETAKWARENIDGVLPSNLERHHATKVNIAHYLPQCNKAIFAVGFKKRSSVVIKHYESATYNSQTGIIAPGLFGFGIAYPECRVNEIGMSENKVGLWKFMDYLNRILPIWLKYGT